MNSPITDAQTTIHTNEEVTNHTETASSAICATHQRIQSNDTGERTHANVPPYEVGYGRPPKATQFKPGQSGNPKGRPRKDYDDLRHELAELYAEQVSVTVDGEAISISRLGALLLKQISRGMQGNDRALQNALANAKSFAVLTRSLHLDKMWATVGVDDSEYQ